MQLRFKSSYTRNIVLDKGVVYMDNESNHGMCQPQTNASLWNYERHPTHITTLPYQVTRWDERWVKSSWVLPGITTSLASHFKECSLFDISRPCNNLKATITFIITKLNAAKQICKFLWTVAFRSFPFHWIKIKVKVNVPLALAC